jgi:hypothetical protein
MFKPLRNTADKAFRYFSGVRASFLPGSQPSVMKPPGKITALRDVSNKKGASPPAAAAIV